MRKIGEMKFVNGDTYNGEYDEDGLMSGAGKLQYANGDHYCGDFLQGLMHGSGKMTYHNNARYTGEFKYDLLDGDGEYQYPDGSVYQGAFKEGLQHGLGCMSNPNDVSQLFGYWEDGEYSGLDKPEALKALERIDQKPSADKNHLESVIEEADAENDNQNPNEE